MLNKFKTFEIDYLDSNKNSGDTQNKYFTKLFLAQI